MTSITKTIIVIAVIVVAILAAATGLFKLSKNQQPVTVSNPNDLVGKPMPRLDLTDKDGRLFDWASLKDKKVVLFFNEGLMCYPACWDQMAAFGKDQRFNNDTTAAISIITDSPHEWDRAVQKMPDLAKELTLFDAQAKVSKDLGLLSLPSSMHPGQSLGHTYMLIDKQGVVREVIDDPNMAVNNDKVWEKINQY